MEQADDEAQQWGAPQPPQPPFQQRQQQQQPPPPVDTQTQARQRQDRPSNQRRDHHHQPVNFPILLEHIRDIDERIGRAQSVIMNKDGNYTQIHLHRARDADLLEQFCRDKLPADDIYVPAQHQPVNPEDEDDVVPDQHAAFGIQRATQARREPAWRDHGLSELMSRGPEAGVWKGSGGGAGRSGSGGAVGGGAGAGTRTPSRLPR